MSDIIILDGDTALFMYRAIAEVEKNGVATYQNVDAKLDEFYAAFDKKVGADYDSVKKDVVNAKNVLKEFKEINEPMSSVKSLSIRALEKSPSAMEMVNRLEEQNKKNKGKNRTL